MWVIAAYVVNIGASAPRCFLNMCVPSAEARRRRNQAARRRKWVRAYNCGRRASLLESASVYLNARLLGHFAQPPPGLWGEEEHHEENVPDEASPVIALPDSFEASYALGEVG